VDQVQGRRRILVVGSGVASLEFMLELAKLAPDRADIQFVAPESAFRYRQFAVAATLGVGPRYELELERVASHLGARFHRGRVTSIDTGQRIVLTSSGQALSYDLLVVACGAQPEQALRGALTFRDERDQAAYRVLLGELVEGSVSQVVFAVPPGAVWSLPLYELALMTAAQLQRQDRTGYRFALVTPEANPLGLFGAAASRAIAELLEAAGIGLHCLRYVERIAGRELRLVPRGSLPAERVVALPRLRGPRLAGLVCDADGFLPTDVHGRLLGLEDVYAAGDATSFPVKQGGIAVQQAKAVAEAVAWRLGAPVEPRPFRPMLRGLLLTGHLPRFVSADIAGGGGETSTVAAHPLWWPPSKIAGANLTRYLTEQGLPLLPGPAGPAAIAVEVELVSDEISDPEAGGGHLTDRPSHTARHR
jgi:sulfide:quinone oxidoreductase